jgi:hypothetical protein
MEYDYKDPNYFDMGSDDDPKTTAPTPATRSTGPRTETGKAIASKNALKHGIFSASLILTPFEDRKDYDALLSGLNEYLNPVGALEDFLVEKLAMLIWRYRRLMINERVVVIGAEKSLYSSPKANQDALNLSSRYETTIDRAFDRTLTQLERIQRMRLGQPVSPPIKIDVSSS